MPNKIYAFRLRYTRSPRDTINCKEKTLPLPIAEPGRELVLKAREADKTIETSGSLTLNGAGWPTNEEAERTGRFYADVLSRTCARLRLGVDFGDRAGKSFFTKAGLDAMSERSGRPVLNDVHGLMTYEQTGNPGLAFASMNAKGTRGIGPDRFLSVFGAALARPRELSKQEQVALEMFNSSFFQDSADGRFVLLMIAIEALIEQQPRDEMTKAIVQGFLSQVDALADLDGNRKHELKSGLGYLQIESISQAGRRMLREKLGAREYEGMPADQFFGSCYSLRSRLVHGLQPFPASDEVKNVVAQLEVMASHLLSTDLLDAVPD
ncbi:MAG TPA: HEPN domain-containing protein [Candidatus Aminicenantes bacterium]|nr:HEPN domain-containing protein [Candidatus Aminicenantes bacterium]HRY66353.1 HEPN domain-containing protein [Candidatus Aminicenantes bacterium]HRZ72600.1 HEPN domain-containing protein [Candidatus Aminicenantes bacterium]